MNIKLYHGDCLGITPREIADHSVDFICADLPYGTTACVFDVRIPFEPLWAEYKRVIKPKGAVVLFGSQPFTSMLVMSNLEWFKYCWVWEKDHGANFGTVKYRPFDVSEDIAVFSEGTHTYNPQMWEAGFVSNKSSRLNELIPENNVYGKSGLRPTFRDATDRYPRNVIMFSTPKHNDGANRHLHPTQKPVALLEYLVKTYTNLGDVILDNVMGSGTTGVACMNTGRKFIGIEMYPLPGRPVGNDNPDYFGIAQERIEKTRIAAHQLRMAI